jgi:alpha-glucosidase (family GH31 glycosyl hydrolase)
VLRYAARLDQFPVFGREGYALPLGRAVQHTGEINVANPLELLWLFGRPTQAVDGYGQLQFDVDRGGACKVRAALNVDVQVFGDPAAVDVLPL